MKNISLIGMPGCGKTTIGRILAEGLGYYFVDLDEYIENKSGMRIDYIFENFGEKFFRKLESESLKEVLAGSKKVIATGGGVVTVEENVETLRENSLVFYIKRNLKDILKDIDIEKRPLLKDNPNAIYELYNKRHKIYEKCAHFLVINDKSAYETAKHIMMIVKQEV